MKKKELWKKGIVLMLSVSLLAVAGCGDQNGQRGAFDPDTEEEEPTKAADVVEATPTEEPEATPTAEPEAETDYEALYAPVLAENMEMIQNGYDFDQDYQFVSTGLMEAAMYRDPDELQSSVGFVIMDINGDGVQELLIGEDEIYDAAGNTASIIFNCFTIKDGAPYESFQGWARSSYRWKGNNSFIYSGSSGAAYSSFGVAHLTPDGTDLGWDEYYFTTENATGDGVDYYRNTDGITDPAVSEQMNIVGEEFWAILDAYPAKKLSWKHFSNYTPAAGSSQGNMISPADSIVGCWTLRSYVNMDIIGYQFFDDGTWLVYENPTVAAGFGKRTEDLAGWWQGSNGGKDYEGYVLLKDNGNVLSQAQLYEESGQKALDLGQNLVFYKSENEDPEPDELLGSWLFPNGATLCLENANDWTLCDDEGNWLFGGHWIHDMGPNGEILRLHSFFGDTGNMCVAEGSFDYDSSGYAELKISFIDGITEFTGSNMILNKALD